MLSSVLWRFSTMNVHAQLLRTGFPMVLLEFPRGKGMMFPQSHCSGVHAGWHSRPPRKAQENKVPSTHWTWLSFLKRRLQLPVHFSCLLGKPNWITNATMDTLYPTKAFVQSQYKKQQKWNCSRGSKVELASAWPCLNTPRSPSLYLWTPCCHRAWL